MEYFEQGLKAPPHFEIGGRGYSFARDYRYAGLSGWTWFVYKNTGEPRY